MIGWLVVLGGLAQAAWTLEGPVSADRSSANASGKVAKEAGFKNRVVRRIGDGGWEYVVRVDGLDDEASARDAAQRLATAWKHPVAMFDDAGAHAGVIEAEAAPPSAAPASPEGDAAGEALLARATAAHGNGVAWLAEAERVQFVYVRELADGRQARHTYARRGTDLYLAIEPVKGEVASSRTLVLGERAWLTQQGGKPAEQDLQRARETIEHFGPISALPVVIGLERVAADYPELAGLFARGTARVGDEVCAVAASRPGGPDVMIAFADADGLVRRIAFDGGKRVHEYGDYSAVADGVQMPGLVRTFADGAPRDLIRVEQIAVDVDLPPAWFAAP